MVSSSIFLLLDVMVQNNCVWYFTFSCATVKKINSTKIVSTCCKKKIYKLVCECSVKVTITKWWTQMVFSGIKGLCFTLLPPGPLGECFTNTKITVYI
jgi:hypothetical protein